MRRNLLGITFFCLVVFIDAKLDVVDLSINNQPGGLISTNVRTSGRAPILISGNVTYLKDLSNEQRVSVDVKKTNGLLSVLDFPGLITMNICDAIKKFYDRYIKTTFKTGENTNLDFKNGKLCPIPKGTYWMKDIVLDLNKWKLPWWVLPGSYNINVSVLNKDGSPGGNIAFQAKLKRK